MARRCHVRQARGGGCWRPGVKRDDGDPGENFADRLHGDRRQDEADGGGKGKVGAAGGILLSCGGGGRGCLPEGSLVRCSQ